MAFRPTILAAVLFAPSLVACGGDDGGGITPEGEHYQMVANKVFVPTTSSQAREYGLDLDGNGTVDNQLGMVLSSLKQFFDVQAQIDTAVAEGGIVLLVDVQTKDFTNSSAAGFQVFLGENPTPAPCTGTETYDPATKMGCQHHLDGTGSFKISATSPNDAAIGGKIVNGQFTGGPGNLSLQIALGSTQGIKIDLIGARVKAEGITATGLTGAVVAGAVTKESLDAQVIPAVQTQLTSTIAGDCNALTSPPDCGCTADSTGKQLLGLFDAGTKDCKVSVDEIKSNSLIASALSPDVTIDGKMSLSLGVKATAVKATYTLP